MNDRGAVLVEYAILLPVIVSVIFGGLDMSLATITAGRLQFATEATSRCVVLGTNPQCTPGNAATYLTNALGASPSEFTVNPGQPCGTVVSASYNYVPFILPASMIPTLNATACYP
jgi:Flp pilus assembly protein TadG